MPLSKIKSTGIDDNSVTSAKILDGTIVNADVNACAAIANTKLSGVVTSADANVIEQNIALLGFKMAVNDGLTVFNLVDGVVDEFHDESGTDEGEGSNDTYCASSDFYRNQTAGASIAAGFGITNIDEPTTSTAGTNPTGGSGAFGTFTVPTGVTSVDILAFGAGGGNGGPNTGAGGPGGFAEGTLAVTASQVLYVHGGEGGNESGSDHRSFGIAPGGKSPNDTTSNQLGGGGGAAAGVVAAASYPQLSQPQAYVIAGGGGGSTVLGPATEYNANGGGGGGGLTGNNGTPDGNSEVTSNGIAAGSNNEGGGGGGSQTTGGQGGEWSDPRSNQGQSGSALSGGNGYNTGSGGGGGGYYGGGGGAAEPSGAVGGHGGGGSSYYGHPQITSGATEDGNNLNHPDGINQNSPQDSYCGSNPLHAALNTLSPGLGKGSGANSDGPGNSGAVMISGTSPDVTVSTTIVSNAFTASSAPSTSRIVVFQENIASTTLNTDIVASISRDGGSTFTTATLSDSGYVTGSSGQRILTGTATISGQPSGTSMRWKLALANNASKIHGVSLKWK